MVDVAIVFVPGAGSQQQNENYDETLLGLGKDEKIEKTFHPVG